MLVTDIIRAKRDGNALSDEQIQFFVDGLADQSIPAEQVSALAMAVYLNGMSFAEAGQLTQAMTNSGTVLEWSSDDLDGPVVDKHSTGGVGDKVSFLLAPIAAACGCYVPMISGRGLGHTGGTTDKVESIPGYVSMPDFDTFKRVVKTTGCAVIGQTLELAPADRRFYAIRDVSGTVESVPLITASILSKKIAAGLDALVMDVKVGTGAFMETPARARELAKSIIATAANAGLKAHALVTDMNEVLGTTAGNALEIEESMRFLRNEVRDPRLNDVVLGLTGEMLLAAGAELDRDTAIERCDKAITSGQAAEVFAKMCSELGGPADFVDTFDQHLPKAPVIKAIHAEGILRTMNVRQIGDAITELGGGRKILGDALDHSVGFSSVAGLGAQLDANTPLALIHAANEADAARAEEQFLAACEIGDGASVENPVISEILAG